MREPAGNGNSFRNEFDRVVPEGCGTMRSTDFA